MEADVWLERAMALASMCIYAARYAFICVRALLSLLIVTKPLRYLALTYRRGVHTGPYEYVVK